MGSLYETDFYAWAQQQAALLRAGKLAEAELHTIAEEIESMGKSEKRECVHRLSVLLMHLLKWQFQPGRRGTSWVMTLRNQRRALLRLFRDNPSLRAVVPELLADAYGDAVNDAIAETGLAEQVFPVVCPWEMTQILDDDFWPEGR